MSLPISDSKFNLDSSDFSEIWVPEIEDDLNKKTKNCAALIFNTDETDLSTGSLLKRGLKENEQPVAKRACTAAQEGKTLLEESLEPTFPEDLLTKVHSAAQEKIVPTNQGDLTSATSSETIEATHQKSKKKEILPIEIGNALIAKLEAGSTFEDKIKAIILLLRKKGIREREVKDLFSCAECNTITINKISKFWTKISKLIPKGNQEILSGIEGFPIFEKKTLKNELYINALAKKIREVLPNSLDRTALQVELENALSEATKIYRIIEELKGDAQNAPEVPIGGSTNTLGITEDKLIYLQNVITKIDQFYSINPTIISQFNKENFILSDHLNSAQKQKAISSIDTILLIRTISLIKGSKNELDDKRLDAKIMREVNTVIHPVKENYIRRLKDSFIKNGILALTNRAFIRISDKRQGIREDELSQRLLDLIAFVPEPQNTTTSEPAVIDLSNAKTVSREIPHPAIPEDHEKLWKELEAKFPPQ